MLSSSHIPKLEDFCRHQVFSLRGKGVVNRIAPQAARGVGAQTPQLGTFHWRYYEEADDLGIYFKKAKPGVIDESDHVYDSIILDYDNKRQLVSVDISCASQVLEVCHFLGVPEEVDGKQAFVLHPVLDTVTDELQVFFFEQKPFAAVVPTEDKRFFLGLNAGGKLEGFVVHAATSNVAV